MHSTSTRKYKNQKTMLNKESSSKKTVKINKNLNLLKFDKVTSIIIYKHVR